MTAPGKGKYKPISAENTNEMQARMHGLTEGPQKGVKTHSYKEKKGFFFYVPEYILVTTLILVAALLCGAAIGGAWKLFIWVWVKA